MLVTVKLLLDKLCKVDRSEKLRISWLFKLLIDSINKETLSFLFKAEISVQKDSNIQQPSANMQQRVKATKDEIPNTDELRQRNNSIISRQSKNEVETIIRTKPKIGRNDKCPCGSGKKFKHCHGNI